MRKFYRFIAGIFSAFVISTVSPALYLQQTLPDVFTVTKGEEFKFSSDFDFINCSNSQKSELVSVYGNNADSFSSELKLFNLIKIKDVTVQLAEKEDIAICGVPFGIKMCTDGVIVVGTGSVQSENGLICPAKIAGIQEGDLLMSINGQNTLSNSLISQLVQQSNGSPLSIVYKRNEQEFSTIITPAFSVTDNRWHIGLWVRDSSAGIGTLTFCRPSDGTFVGLGHAICDVDTGQLMPLAQGEIVHAAITGLSVGLPGRPGELQGTFCSDDVWGTVNNNCSSGIYGKFQDNWSHFPIVSIARSQEVSVGDAQILCTISGIDAQYYDAEIEQIHSFNDPNGRNLVIKITDSELLSKTGGILQGMSGSPILQNGKLIGAVTHVFVNDPTKGYGIFIENMLDAAK